MEVKSTVDMSLLVLFLKSQDPRADIRLVDDTQYAVEAIVEEEVLIVRRVEFIVPVHEVEIAEGVLDLQVVPAVGIVELEAEVRVQVVVALTVAPAVR